MQSSAIRREERNPPGKAADALLEEIYPQIIDQAEINPYGPGSLEAIKPSPLTFTIRVPLEPEVTLGDYRAMRQAWEEVTVNDEEVANVLEQVRHEHAILEPYERPVQYGDEVHINVVGTVHGEKVVDEKDIEVTPKEDAQFIAPGFLEALIGMSTSEDKLFTIAFPEDFSEPTFRGRGSILCEGRGAFIRILPNLRRRPGQRWSLRDAGRSESRCPQPACRWPRTRTPNRPITRHWSTHRRPNRSALPSGHHEQTLDEMMENAEKRTQRSAICRSRTPCSWTDDARTVPRTNEGPRPRANIRRSPDLEQVRRRTTRPRQR